MIIIKPMGPSALLRFAARQGSSYFVGLFISEDSTREYHRSRALASGHLSLYVSLPPPSLPSLSLSLSLPLPLSLVLAVSCLPSPSLPLPFLAISLSLALSVFLFLAPHPPAGPHPRRHIYSVHLHALACIRSAATYERTNDKTRITCNWSPR